MLYRYTLLINKIQLVAGQFDYSFFYSTVKCQILAVIDRLLAIILSTDYAEENDYEPDNVKHLNQANEIFSN